MDAYYVDGMPKDISEEDAAVCRSRFMNALYSLQEKSGKENLHLRVGIGESESRSMKATDANKISEVDCHSGRFCATDPIWRMEQLVIPPAVLDELRTAISLIQLEPLVFDSWGLRDIEPFPRSALNFHGEPGTGKTLAAHAVAADLNKKILVASYAQIESMYHGEGPKNMDALFAAAQEQEAVLFIDEADSLLSRRLTNVRQGSEHAINAMCSQILLCLERHKGVVIFATNLVESYDPAFESRVRHVHFPLPDTSARIAIWRNHLPKSLPLHADVDLNCLADLAADFCGRDIKNAVVNAALNVARVGGEIITHADLAESVSRIMNSRAQVRLGNTRSQTV